MAKSPTALNFRFKKNVQTGEIKRATDNFAQVTSQMILEDVAFAAAGYTFYQVQNNIKQRIVYELQREMDHMVSQISVMMNPPDRARSPQGDINNLAGGSPMTPEEAGVSWRHRTLDYMRWKHKHNKPSEWWIKDGNLRAKLSQPSFYTYNFGPIKVDVVRNTKVTRDPKTGRFQSRGTNTSIGRAENLTSFGAKGRPQTYYSVATITVSVFGRITAEMLPSLTGTDPRKIAPPNRNGARVIDLIRNRDVRRKLGAGKRGEYRQLLDPFLSYYLTRTVPVRVNQIIDKTIQRTADSSTGIRLSP